MAEITRYPTTDAAVSGTWTSPTSVQADDGVVASVTPGAKNTAHVRAQAGYGFDGVIPSGAIIDSVFLEVDWSTTGAGVNNLGVAGVVGGVVQTFQENIAEPAILTAQSFDVTALRAWTRADLLNASFGTQIQGRNGNNTAGAYSFDYVRVRVVYTVPDTTAPTAPSTLAATDVAAPVLTWTASTDAVGVTKYEVERKTGVGGTYAKIGEITGAPPATTYTDTTASGNTTYYYRVRALDAALNIGGYSNEDTGITPAQYKATLDWADNLEADLAGYNIYRSETAVTGFVKINGSLVVASTYIDTPLPDPAATYYYRVTAVDASGNESGNSAEVSTAPGGAAQSLTVTGIASSQAIGSPTLSRQIAPTGIASLQAIGSPTLLLAQTLTAIGIASQEAIGAPGLSQAASGLSLAVTGLGSAEALGSPTLLTAVSISVTGITSQQAIGLPGLNQSIAPLGIASQEAVGIAALQYPQSVAATGIVSQEAIGAPALSQGAASGQSLAPTGIVSGEVVGSPGLSQQVAPSGIASAQALGLPVLNQQVATTGLPSSEMIGQPSISQDVRPTGIASQEVVGAPTLQYAQNLSTTGIASQEALGTPTVVSGAGVLAVSGIASAQAIGQPTLNQQVAPTGITSQQAMGQPTLTLVLTVAGIPSAEVLGTVSLTRNNTLSVLGLTSQQAIGSPGIAQGITPLGIPSLAVLGQPGLTGGVVGVLSLNVLGIPSQQAIDTALLYITPLASTLVREGGVKAKVSDAYAAKLGIVRDRSL